MKSSDALPCGDLGYAEIVCVCVILRNEPKMHGLRFANFAQYYKDISPFIASIFIRECLVNRELFMLLLVLRDLRRYNSKLIDLRLR